MTEFNGTVSEADRDYFRRLAAFNAELDAMDRERWFAKSLDERLEIVFARAATAPRQDHSDERPEELYERARRLGLYIE